MRPQLNASCLQRQEDERMPIVCAAAHASAWAFYQWALFSSAAGYWWACRQVSWERLRCVLVLACVWSARRHWLLSARCSSHLPLLLPLIKHSADMAFLQFSKAFRPDDVTILYLSYCMFIKLCDFCLHFTANELENSEFFPHDLPFTVKVKLLNPKWYIVA